MKNMFNYLRFYLEPDRIEIQKLAIKSWREYVSMHPEKRYDMTFCQNYQAGYEKQYRTAYAKNLLESTNNSKSKINK